MALHKHTPAQRKKLQEWKSRAGRRALTPPEAARVERKKVDAFMRPPAKPAPPPPPKPKTGLAGLVERWVGGRDKLEEHLKQPEKKKRR